jgi:UDP-N-acetylglucosamine--N-acetylmuramyl-(pentapeptide) pyrophosphoryl-undecaprenol N-acetylglucosamine transferase
MISGGGTGGHVYPALAVVQAFKDKHPLELLWLGSRGGLEKGLVEQAGIPFRGISAAGLRGKNPLALLEGVLKLSRGYWQSRRLLAEYQPDVLFITGGYVCAPVSIAAHQAGIPILIYLPDIEPGQAIKFLSRYATKVAVTAPPTQAFFPVGLTVVTGYPVREALIKLILR